MLFSKYTMLVNEHARGKGLNIFLEVTASIGNSANENDTTILLAFVI